MTTIAFGRSPSSACTGAATDTRLVARTPTTSALSGGMRMVKESPRPLPIILPLVIGRIWGVL
ncbi:MAG: hypothetical protein EBY93_03150 [Actinobacteria bacterium]|nr:hypothetical protein [Actinomycetota bacterium]